MLRRAFISCHPPRNHICTLPLCIVFLPTFIIIIIVFFLGKNPHVFRFVSPWENTNRKWWGKGKNPSGQVTWQPWLHLFRRTWYFTLLKVCQRNLLALYCKTRRKHAVKILSFQLFVGFRKSICHFRCDCGGVIAAGIYLYSWILGNTNSWISSTM